MRILVLHPSQKIGNSIKDLLARNGHSVSIVQREDEAWEALGNRIDRIELVVAYEDEGQGTSLRLRLKADGRMIPFIFILSSTIARQHKTRTIYGHAEIETRLPEFIETIEHELKLRG